MSGKVRIEQDRFSTLALSTGQKKRLALLTAYLEDRPVYVFDEWAADQDPTYKEIFYLRLLPELNGARQVRCRHHARRPLLQSRRSADQARWQPGR